MDIRLEFGGGAELLCGGSKARSLSLESRAEGWRIRDLLSRMAESVLTERPELFLQGGTVRPGILVLVNDVDWELCGELDYAIQPDDTIAFISTLHGG